MKSIFLFILLLPVALTGFSQNTCALKFGSCYFINCKHILVEFGDDVFTLGEWNDELPEVTFTIRAQNRRVLALVANGRLIYFSKSHFTVKSSTEEYSVVDDSTKRIIFLMKKVKPDHEDFTCQIDLYADLVMKNLDFFQCSPEKCNLNVMQNMNGAIFKGSDVVFTIYWFYANTYFDFSFHYSPFVRSFFAKKSGWKNLSEIE